MIKHSSFSLSIFRNIKKFKFYSISNRMINKSINRIQSR
ncbi:hypothetical protein LEP1GSC008_3196 [Leptospira kirschneri serovar Bulgarica str. Nikolaevo]|uniref:Uncharacterized protein n=1 Tax=Leptospira kirschneri serovar Bulgarica str. Nikolaevo TaxID=1240687 RepID=M6F483_9LEPT|nr:hypothetical protein LEP1GSC008_3196 [Leptospira kirschneri serovar Bulgarica str. Nikolaevo]